jgi:hypothetical protein
MDLVVLNYYKEIIANRLNCKIDQNKSRYS